MQVNLDDPGLDLHQLIALIEAGTVPEIEIVRGEVVIARLVPGVRAGARRPGRLAGKIRIGEDFDAPLPGDIGEAFGMYQDGGVRE